MTKADGDCFRPDFATGNFSTEQAFNARVFRVCDLGERILRFSAVEGSRFRIILLLEYLRHDG